MGQRINHNDITRVLYKNHDIARRVRELAFQLSSVYARSKEPPILICVLQGAHRFHSDLIGNMTIHVQREFIRLSSMKGAKSSGEVTIECDIKTDIQGRDVVIVEDIIDTGLTVSWLLEHLGQLGAKSIKVCTLLAKRGTRTVDVPIDYHGFDIPDVFVVGYGLDYKGRYHNLPYIGILDSQIYESKS